MRIFKKRPFLWAILAIALIVFISYGQTLRMYFWQDDSALIFRLQNPVGQVGSFGNNLVGAGAYKYLAVLFVPFFKVFGLEPLGYFAVGLLTYLLASGAFYLFAQELFKNKKAGFFATLVFAAGYVGSDTMFRIINSWQTNVGLTLALATFWLFTRYLREGGVGKYLASLALFLATIELVFIRSHSLILPILALDVLVRFAPPRVKELPRLVLRQIPFWFFWQKWYLADPAFGGPGIKNLFERIFQGELVALAPLLANIGNGLVPDVLQTRVISFFDLGVFGASVLSTILAIALLLVLGRIYEASIKSRLVVVGFLLLAFILNQLFYETSPLWYRDVQSVVAGLMGLQVTILILYASWIFWPKNKIFATSLLFGLIVLVSQIFGYYSQYPTAIFSTTHRYFSHSFIGYSLLFGAIAYWLSRAKKIGMVPLLLLLLLNLALGVRYQARLVAERSLPTRKFYQDLKAFVPKIEKGAVFYFDVSDEPFYQRQFGDFFSVGSMPESTALAIYYQLDRYDLVRLTNFDELAFKLSQGEITIDNLYTFFYGPLGLQETTEKTRELLKNGSVFSAAAEISPLTPLLVRIEARVLPADVADFPYRYGGGGKAYPLEEKLTMLNYLKSRKSYYRDVRVRSLSEWKFREVRNAVDDDPASVWQGHRIWWHDNKHEQLTVDLGRVLPVGRVVWRNWTAALSPTSYTIEVSLDGQTWERVREVAAGPERKNGELVVEDFAARRVRFIRMDIEATLTDDSPAIAEFEVVEAKYAAIDQGLAEEFLANPFGFVATRQDWDTLYENIGPLAKIKLALVTDKGEVNTTLPMVVDGASHIYEHVVAAGGTRIENIKVTANIPAKIEIGQIRLRNLSVAEQAGRGLIKVFAEN